MIRLEGTFGQISAYDSILENVKKSNAIGRYSRNLQFRSYISEVALVAEFHPSHVFGLFNEDSYFASLSPYFMGGIAYYHFNPQTKLNSEWIELQPLHTEGQGFDEYPTRKNYKLFQFNFPVGVGFKYQFTSNFNLRLEGLFRISRTDYLDDVSTRYIDPALFSKYLSGTALAQALILNNRVRPGTPRPETTARPGGIRGHPQNNDHYFTVNLKVGYVFGGDYGPGGESKRSRNQQKCPAVF
jgi:opacity protein-like surface antigen